VRKAAGVREVVLGLARAQRDTGLDIAVIGIDHPDWPSEQHEWEGIPTRLLQSLGPRRFGYAPRIVDVLHEMAPDVVHLHGLWMYPGCSVLQWHRGSGRPYVISPHGMLSDVALSYSRFRKNAVSLWYQDAVFARAAALHATSDDEAGEIRAYGLRKPICVVPNGIAEIARPTTLLTPGRTILSLGRIHRKKALDHLILAWQRLERDFPEWSVQIVGPDEGGEVARLRALIDKTGVQRVSISGPVYGEEKVYLMAGAALFALPTHSENFAITVAESLMLEVPVVASHGAPWKGLVAESCGLWVPIGPTHMADGLRQMMMLTDEERRVMGSHGRRWMLREFSWLSMVERLSSCYSIACG
jgi:glycosyltransferase involved in cell wall biosynthesis